MSVVTYENPSDNIALITLNRPDALNAITGEVRVALLDAVCKASADDHVRAVVITGAGRAFCAGADLKDLGGERIVEDVLNAEYGAFLNVIQSMEKPVISAINGPAAGIGFTLSITCDLRVMAEDAYQLSAFANIGLVPDGGLTWLLTHQIGYARAYQLAIEAEKITAEKSLALGLVNRIVPSGEAVKEALAWASSLAERAPISMGLAKKAFRASADQGLRNAMALEAMLQRQAIKTDDCKEGVAALFEKRKPAFKGR